MLTEWQRDENVYMHEVACACGTASVNEWTVECSISVFLFYSARPCTAESRGRGRKSVNEISVFRRTQCSIKQINIITNRGGGMCMCKLALSGRGRRQVLRGVSDTRQYYIEFGW